MENKYDVFISYSTQDQKVVEGICGYLERKGYRCFVAYRDIPYGKVWATAITEALDESAMMVVVFSNSFNVSAQTDREIEIASENKMPILTYRVTDSEMTGAKKYYLKNLNWIDAFPNPESCFGQLVDSVVKLIGLSSLEAERLAKEAEQKTRSEQERLEVGNGIKNAVENHGFKRKEHDSQEGKVKGNDKEGEDEGRKFNWKEHKWWIIGGSAAVAIALTLLLVFVPFGDKHDPLVPDHVESDALFPFMNEYFRWGFVDKSGKTVIEPKGYGLFPIYNADEDALKFDLRRIKTRMFYDGLSQVIEVNGKFGYIDRKGEIVIPVQFDYAGAFSEGLAVVGKRNYNEEWEFGFIDKTGAYVLRPIYLDVKPFSEGLAAVYKDGRWGFIDKTGKMVIEPQFEYVSVFSEGLACVGNVDGNGSATDDRKYGFIDKTGKDVISPKFDKAIIFSEGLAAVRERNKWGFIDKNGDYVINPQFEDAMMFTEGLSPVQINDKWGFIDKNGNLVVKCKYETVKPFSEGLAAVTKNGKTGFIDKSGKMVIAAKYSDALSFWDGVALVTDKENKEISYIDKEGKTIKSFIVDSDLY